MSDRSVPLKKVGSIRGRCVMEMEVFVNREVREKRIMLQCDF